MMMKVMIVWFVVLLEVLMMVVFVVVLCVMSEDLIFVVDSWCFDMFMMLLMWLSSYRLLFLFSCVLLLVK